jgi:hypothetical protein
MTKVVASRADAGMTANAAGESRGLMAMGNGFMCRRRSTMNRYHRRHQYLFTTNSYSLKELPQRDPSYVAVLPNLTD